MLQHAILVGLGGLGCPAALALSAAGVRRLTLVDPDVVASSNLQRQVLFTPADVGLPKVDAAARALRRRLPELGLERRRAAMTPAAWEALADEAAADDAVILEGTDDPTSKFDANDACLRRGARLVIGAALGWAGQALAVRAGHTCYRCLFETPPPAELVPTCEAAGVLGATVGVVGSHMAALALALADSDDVAGRFWSLDLRSTTLRTLEPTPRPGCPACAASRTPLASPPPTPFDPPSP